MPIETTFAIQATPETIWDALWSELGLGEEGTFSVEGSAWPRRLSLKLNVGGLPCVVTYTIESKDGACEVTASLEPIGLRYPIYQVFTFGHIGRNYKMLLATGLSNLKSALEGPKEDVESDGE